LAKGSLLPFWTRFARCLPAMFGKSASWPAAAGYTAIIAVSILVFAAAVQLILSSCPCSSLMSGRLGAMEVTPTASMPDQQNRVVALGTATFLYVSTWVMISKSEAMRKYSSVGYATRLCFVAAVLYASDPYFPSGALKLTVLWLVFYSMLTWVLQWASGDAVVECCGVQAKLSELLAAFAHNGGTMTILLVLIIWHPPACWSQWLNGSWSSVLQEGSGPLHVFSSILAGMLRDILLTEAEVNMVSVGMLLHHFATIGGCILSFASPMGIGAMALNGLNLELGSATYSGFLLIPANGEHRRFRHWARKFYWLAMTASNLFGIYLALEWYAKLPIFWGLPCMYSLLGAMLCFLRQAVLIANVVETMSESGE